MDPSGSDPVPRRFLTPRRLLVAALVSAAGLVVLLVWFQPQKLIQDTRVDEAPPGIVAEGDDAMAEGDGATTMSDALTLIGTFRSLDHTTSGTATLAQADGGHHYVRLEDFSTENGPDLFVYLSAAPAAAEGRDFAEDFIDLGPLKGNMGNQNYVVPDGTDLEKYRNLVIWCRRFTSPFGAALLERA